MVGPVWSGAQKEIPVKTGWRVVRLGGPVDCLRPDRPVGPVLDLPDRPDDARFDPFPNLSSALTRVALIPHLRHHTPLAGRGGEGAGFGDGPRQRFLAIHVLATLHRLHRDDRVCVVWSRDDHRVDVRFAIEHLTVVGIGCGIGVLPERPRREPGVDVAECHDVLAAAPLEVGSPSAADADPRDVEGVAWGLYALSAQYVSWHDHHADGGR